MKICIAVLVALASLSAHAETKQDKDVAECNKQAEAAGDEAVAKAKMQSPDDVTEIKRKAKTEKVIQCLRARNYVTGPIRAK